MKKKKLIQLCIKKRELNFEKMEERISGFYGVKNKHSNHGRTPLQDSDTM